MTTSTAPHRFARVGGCTEATLSEREGGIQVLTSMRPWPPTGQPDRRAGALGARSPERTALAQRNAQGAWQRLSYAELLTQAKSIGQALLDAGVTVERPLVILSDNSLEHAALMMGAMWAGVPALSASRWPMRCCPPTLRGCATSWTSRRPASSCRA